MRDLLPRLVKWVLSILFLIAGLKMIHMAIEGQAWAFMPGLLCLGLVYWQYNGRDDIPKQIMLVTVFVLAVAGAAAFYVPALPFFPFSGGAFMAWAGWSMALGLPVVGWAFKKFD